MEQAVVFGLKARGIDVTTAIAEGLPDASDDEQLDFAAAHERVLFSFNAADFVRIHTERLSTGQSHAGIIIAPQQRYSVGERIRRLLVLLCSVSAEAMRDRIEFLSNWSYSDADTNED
jgi:hypothetical protein